MVRWTSTAVVPSGATAIEAGLMVNGVGTSQVGERLAVAVVAADAVMLALAQQHGEVALGVDAEVDRPAGELRPAPSGAG